MAGNSCNVSFGSMPADVFNLIVLFVGDLFDLLSLRLTCRRFKQMIENCAVKYVLLRCAPRIICLSCAISICQQFPPSPSHDFFCFSNCFHSVVVPAFYKRRRLHPRSFVRLLKLFPSLGSLDVSSCTLSESFASEVNYLLVINVPIEREKKICTNSYPSLSVAAAYSTPFH